MFQGEWPVVPIVAVCVWLHRDDLLSSTQLSQTVRCCQKRAQNGWFNNPRPLGEELESSTSVHCSWILTQKKKNKTNSKLVLVKTYEKIMNLDVKFWMLRITLLMYPCKGGGYNNHERYFSV